MLLQVLVIRSFILAKKTAKIVFSLVPNYAFVDGNKRIDMYIMITFLEVNGIYLDCTNEEVVEIGLGLADGSIGYEEILEWIKNHRV